LKIHYVHSRPADSQEANIIQVLQMCRAFGRLGHEVVLSLPGTSQEQTETALAARMGGDLSFRARTFRRARTGGRFKSLSCIPGARAEVAAVRSDLLFVRDALLLPFLSPRHSRVVFEIHNTFVGSPWFSNGVIAPQLVRIARQKKLKAFVTISDALKRWWEDRGIPREKGLAAHDGVDLKEFAGIPQAEARRTLGLPEGGKIVVYTGSLYLDRGVGRILRLAKDRPDVRFIIVGGPEDRRAELEIWRQKEKLNNVELVGHRPQKDVPLYLAAADVLLALWSKSVPTMNYCSPLKLFEYLAAGRLIVADGFPTIREVMKDGQHGFLVDPQSYEALHSAVTAALALSQSDAAAMGRRTEELAGEYTWEKRCRSILKAVRD